MRVFLLSACLLLLAVPAAHAGPVDDLADLTRRSLTSTDPARVFYRGLAELGDVHLGRKQVAQALKLAGVKGQGAWAPVLTSIVELEIQGDQVTIRRDHEVLMSTPNGTMKLDPEVAFRLELDGEDVVLSKIEGLSVGKTDVAPYAVTRTRYTVENGVPVVIAKVRVFFVMQTVRIEIPPEKLQGLADSL